MKKLIFISCVSGLVMLNSCKEKGPAINFGASASLKDTTYMATTEAVSPKKVVVEEFTGASCPNCPDARTTLANISAANPNRVLILELHPTEVPQGRPVAGKSKYDFTNKTVSDIITQFYPGLGAIPMGGIDRVLENTNRLIDRSKWANIINTRLAMTSVANLKLTNAYDETKREGVLTVKVAYTGEVTNKQYITLAIIESDIEDVQEYPTYDDDHYIFKHVLRKTATPVGGTSILDTIAIKKPGRVYEGQYKYTIDAAWLPKNCHIVVFLHNNQSDNKEVLQAEEIVVKE
jgi:hypothetical protein